jgi:4a-hydroxytetrahydrobiopterin dehydratase
MGDIIGLKNKRCAPCEAGAAPALLPEAEVNRLRLQCAGWRVEGAALACAWEVRNFAAGLELMRRIGEVAEAEGHHPDLHLTAYKHVAAELTTHAAGGLTENDFIMAAKINQLELGDLLPKRKAKFWA